MPNVRLKKLVAQKIKMQEKIKNKIKRSELIIGSIIILLILVILELPPIMSPDSNKIHSDVHIPAPSPNTTVVAFIADAKPVLGKNTNNLVNDLNQIKLISPGNVSAIVAIGDMNPLNIGDVNTEKAYNLSSVENIPLFFVIGNHEVTNKNDLLYVDSKFKDYSYSPNPGPDGSRNTTYSFNVGDMHVVVLNEYWDGDTDGTCDWNIPDKGLDRDDSCFKYSSIDGGFIPDALFKWLENDFKNNTKKWTIVVGHEPLYPIKQHVGDSLDENKTNRDKLENLLIQNKVISFIGGHTHIADVRKIDNILQADAGVMGDNKNDGDDFASIIYTYEDVNGNFNLEWTYENPTWASPGLKMFTN